MIILYSHGCGQSLPYKTKQAILADCGNTCLLCKECVDEAPKDPTGQIVLHCPGRLSVHPHVVRCNQQWKLSQVFAQRGAGEHYERQRKHSRQSMLLLNPSEVEEDVARATSIQCEIV